MSRPSLLELAERVESLRGENNAIDVLVEIALFEPDERWASIRANAAGTKAIATSRMGNDATFWAKDWTWDADQRAATAAALRARAAQDRHHDQ